MERRLGRFVVVATLGTGAMGEVFRARDERLGREVAIKTVRNIFGVHADLFRARFEAEARALAALSHPAIVQVHDLGFDETSGEPYLVMELVDGPSLKGRLERGTMNAAEVRGLGIQLARALEAAHARGILHRDVKPANVLLHSNGQWKLADFGVAHVPDSTQTMTGQFLGTPAYAAPEAVILGAFSDKSDVFGLASMLVESLTGRRLRGDQSLSDIVQHADESLAMPPEVPPDLAAPLRAGLARDPRARPTAAEFADLLAGAASVPSGVTVATVAGPHRERERRRLGPIIGAAAGAILLIGLVAALASRGGGEPAAPAAAADPSPKPTAAPQPAPTPVDDHPPPHPPPPHGDPKHAQKDWDHVVDQVRKGHYDEALDKLDHFEEKYGTSPETQQLRAQLEQD